MNKFGYLNIVLAVYRVTENFPKNEPLKYQIREKVNEILADLILVRFEGDLIEKSLKNIKILYEYFQIAEKQNWVDSCNFSFLIKEHDKIKDMLTFDDKDKECSGGVCELKADELQSASDVPFGEMISDTEQEEIEQDVIICDNKKNETNILPRQKKILEILKDKGKSRISGFISFFPDVSKRTLSRDLESLLHQGLIERLGENNDIFYKIRV